MLKKLFAIVKPFFKPLIAIALILALGFGHADNALAARSGGRIGGGSFRAPSRTFAPSPRSAPGGGGYYGGRGFGFPFLLPFFGFGGFGGIFSILIVIAIANFIIRSFRAVGEGVQEAEVTNPKVSIAQVQVGLLAEGRGLQADLDRLAATADTGSAEGRAQVLQEATLALLRHPEYWVYGASTSDQMRLNSAEAKFNQLAIAERSKFTEETLSNVNNQRIGGGETEGAIVPQDTPENPGEYIIVTLVVGTLGQLDLPKIESSQDLRVAIGRLGSVGSEQLLAVEVLWTPQASGDTLSSDDVLAYYPNLRLV
ncbi:DUF1517 domain-containing protein [Lyngbya sp. CCY1209]|uniref:DUF1517 domain-containing protein n=1 Tax=Lyngbya sp. CCY1209 TaxID=2886103 RepID=UPI002D20A58C|nr:DUF1517 domain-containing protein [Lyngbya sp. CCY1209]MEB3886970.1 DUF1517 domain-containing protein [Lyngbya sp. CCY1209]